jgi:hypothetical protein
LEVDRQSSSDLWAEIFRDDVRICNSCSNWLSCDYLGRPAIIFKRRGPSPQDHSICLRIIPYPLIVACRSAIDDRWRAVHSSAGNSALSLPPRAPPC